MKDREVKNMPLVFNHTKIFSSLTARGFGRHFFSKGCPKSDVYGVTNPESQCYEVENIETKEGKVEVVGKDYTVNELSRK